MQIIPLTLEQQVRFGYSHAVKLTYADLTETAAATAQTIALLNVAAFTEVQRVGFYLPTAFSDASDSGFNNVAITIGDGGSSNRYLTSTQINVNGTEIKALSGVLTTAYVYLVADTIDIVFGSMTAKILNDIDGGELWVFLKVAPLANL